MFNSHRSVMVTADVLMHFLSHRHLYFYRKVRIRCHEKGYSLVFHLTF